MNRKRLEAYKAQLQKHPSVIYMPRFQVNTEFNDPEDVVDDVSKLHPCGNVACAAGFLAVTPEFKQAGGIMDELGCPLYEENDGALAFGRYFGIRDDLARGICYDGERMTYNLEVFVEKGWRSWDASHLIKIIDGILEGELE